MLFTYVTPAPLFAQTRTDAEISAQIEKQRRTIAADQYKDRIRRGEAVSTTRAAERDRSGCGKVGIDTGCTQLPKNNMGFGKPPPPMPPDFADVIRGLPEPDDIEEARDKPE
jgi:hypothetical protein